MTFIDLKLNNYFYNNFLNNIKNKNNDEQNLNELKFLIEIKNIINIDNFFKINQTIYFLPNIANETYILKQINNQFIKETFFTINTYNNFIKITPLNIILFIVSNFNENKIHYYDILNNNFNFYTTNLFPKEQNYFEAVYANTEEIIYFIPYKLNIDNLIYFDCKEKKFLTYTNEFDNFLKQLITFKTGCYDYFNNIVILTPYDYNNFLYYIKNKKIYYFDNINLEDKNFLNLNKLYNKSYYSTFTNCIYFFPEQSIMLKNIYYFNCQYKTLNLYENNFKTIIKDLNNKIYTILDDKELNIYFYYNNQYYKFNLIDKKIKNF